MKAEEAQSSRLQKTLKDVFRLMKVIQDGNFNL